jgi:small ligand-binding sensory domain FIST
MATEPRQGDSTTRRVDAAAAHSIRADSTDAADEVAEQLHHGLGPGRTPDLLIFFATADHIAGLSAVARRLQARVGAAQQVGTLAGGVLTTGHEMEQGPALAAIAMRLPGARLHAFTYDDVPFLAGREPPHPDAVAEAIAARHDTRGIMLIADPFSTPLVRLLPTLASCRTSGNASPSLPVIGGMASAGRRPGENRLVIGDRLLMAGAIGVTLSGDFELACMVSQGCRPLGKPYVVTAAKRTLVLELGGRPATEALSETVHGLDDETRGLLGQGLLMGRVIDEYKRYFGRGDFLIRAIVGVDPKRGALGIGDEIRTGQTVQFHLRDASTALEDFRLLLGGQQLYGPPAAGLLFTCSGRGRHLFGAPDCDARAIAETLGADMPLAGFFAAGEIGPIGDHSFLHGHTAALALFRDRDASDAPPLTD